MIRTPALLAALAAGAGVLVSCGSTETGNSVGGVAATSIEQDAAADARCMAVMAARMPSREAGMFWSGRLSVRVSPDQLERALRAAAAQVDGMNLGEQGALMAGCSALLIEFSRAMSAAGASMQHHPE